MTDRFTPGEETPGIYMKDNLVGGGARRGEQNQDGCFR